MIPPLNRMDWILAIEQHVRLYHTTDHFSKGVLISCTLFPLSPDPDPVPEPEQENGDGQDQAPRRDP